MNLPAVLGLFAVTALAEILGCWLVWLWARHGASAWWLVAAAVALAVFAWLLTQHPAASEGSGASWIWLSRLPRGPG